MTDNPRILLIEDDEDDYVLTKGLLVGIFGRDLRLDWVKDWRAALEAIEQEAHDVYLIDYRLGERTGLDLVAEATLRGHTAPMILLTGQDTRDIDLAAMNAGVADYLVKQQLTEALLDRAIRYAIKQKEFEARLAALAEYDPLTGLANRALFQKRLDGAIALAKRLDSHFALLLLDLDRFKDVNDTLGHPEGDRLLTQVAARLTEGARETDTVARLGGDEFAIIASPLSQPSDGAIIAQKILDTVSVSYELGNHAVFTGTSIGISIYPTDADDTATLLKFADIALYHAKDTGRGTYQFFDEEMNARVQFCNAIEGELRQAIEREEFVLHYQPKIDVFNGDVVGVEALIRWNHPERGLMAPGEFIPVAEATGLIVPLGEWVLEAACAQAVAWRESGMPMIPVAVNVSPVQFKRGTIVDTVVKVIERTGIDPAALELEITESLIMEDVDATMRLLDELHRLRVSLAIDDFGTGYSSLAFLKRFPVNKLKIDRSFIRDIAHDPDDAAITRAIINLGESLNLDVIAEGVESEEQLAFLRLQRCREIQGFLISKPLPADAFVEWYASQQRRELSQSKFA